MKMLVEFFDNLGNKISDFFGNSKRPRCHRHTVGFKESKGGTDLFECSCCKEVFCETFPVYVFADTYVMDIPKEDRQGPCILLAKARDPEQFSLFRILPGKRGNKIYHVANFTEVCFAMIAAKAIEKEQSWMI